MKRWKVRLLAECRDFCATGVANAALHGGRCASVKRCSNADGRRTDAGARVELCDAAQSNGDSVCGQSFSHRRSLSKEHMQQNECHQCQMRRGPVPSEPYSVLYSYSIGTLYSTLIYFLLTAFYSHIVITISNLNFSRCHRRFDGAIMEY